MLLEECVSKFPYLHQYQLCINAGPLSSTSMLQKKDVKARDLLIHCGIQEVLLLSPLLGLPGSQELDFARNRFLFHFC